jgi:Spy/CpxP family protein refolding chaperone
MSRTRKVVAAVLATLALAVGVAPVAAANPSPPTNGGNGAGHSGQCTGNPDFRPAVCPGT